MARRSAAATTRFVMCAVVALSGCNNAGDRPAAADGGRNGSSNAPSSTSGGARSTESAGEHVRRTRDSRRSSPPSIPQSADHTSPDGANKNGNSEGRVPAHGTDSTLDIASWNIEWFGDPTHDPSNDRLQREHVRDVILGTDADIWGLAEVVDMGEWQRLKNDLPAYDGFLANEGPVSRSSYYGVTEQKVGILFKKSMVRVLDAKVILTQNNNDFAGRPPLQVRLRVMLRGATEELVLIVLHMKARPDGPSWSRRSAAAVALKDYLDRTFPAQKVLVVGDWNDDVDKSITRGHDSPYAMFVQDAQHYRFITAPLSARGASSTASFRQMIDHHLASQALARTEVARSVEVETVDRYFANYARTTSDHFPVISHYLLSNTIPRTR